MSIPDGKYRGKARDGVGTLIEAGTGTIGMAVEFEFQAADGLETLTWTGWLSDGAADRTIQSLRYAGWKGDDISQVEGLDAEVELVVKAEEREGRWYPRIQFVNRIGGALGAKMAPDKAKTFAASMRARIRALDAAEGTRPAQAPAQRNVTKPPPGRPEPPPLTDDDIPF